MHSIFRDLRYAVRTLRQTPSFTLTAIVCLGLGIAANATIFGIFNALLWKPLDVAQPEALVRAYSQGRVQRHLYQGFPYAEYLDYCRENDVLAGLAATSGFQAAMRASGSGGAVRVFGEAVSDNYFDMLGVRPQLGRLPAWRSQGAPSAVPEIVVSDRFWRLRLLGAADVVGKPIWLSGVAVTVVAVMPPSFKGTYSVTLMVPELWMPLGLQPQLDGGSATQFDDRSMRSLSLIGRMKPGVGLARVQAAFDTIAARLAQSYPKSNEGVKAIVFREIDTHPEVYESRPLNLVAILFLVLAALVLAVACANLANLMLARASARRKEIALRLALGAGRAQLVRQLVTEAILLSLLAGGVGVVIALGAARAISSVRLPTDIPIFLDVAIDLRVLLFTATLSLLAGGAFGLVPALGASRPDLVSALKGADGNRRARRRFTVTNTLVVAQVAFSLVLLVAAGLFWRSIAGTATVYPGMQIAGRTLVSFSPALLRYDAARSAVFYRNLLDRVAQSPEVQSAALASWVPLGFQVEEGAYVIQGAAARRGQDATRAWVNVITPAFLDTTSVPLRMGRAFTEQDTADTAPVAIVNETLARQAWPGLNPLGRLLRSEEANAPWLTVVGVVADGKYRTLVERPAPYLLRPLSQAPTDGLTLVVKDSRDHAASLSAIRRAVQSLDPDMALLDPKTMEQHMAKVRFIPQAMTALAVPIGLLAVVIAAIGLYGVIACAVSRRVREFGIRLAIGAEPRAIVGDVMRRAALMVTVGMTLGAFAAIGVARLAKGVLVGVTPTDPLVFTGAIGLLIAVAMAAAYLPARRASRVSPLAALRQE